MRVLSAFLTSPQSWRWMAAALLICASGLSQAQTQAPPDDNGAGDPPSRVARLSYRTGDVGLLPAGEKDWGDASLNRPLTTGDRLSTGDGGRAELQLDSGVLRIADDSNFGFLTLNDQLTQVELTQGTANVTVQGLDDGQSYEIDTPTVALVIDQPGSYRIDISEDGKSTRVTDFAGHATVYGEGGAQRMVAAGRSYEFVDSSLSVVTINDIQGGDEFDNWVDSRNQQYASMPADPNVSPDIVGAQDLNQYGNWQSDPDYGQVWYPASVGADWSPYSDGHWSYVGPWGWTWVDAAPWGFAPYHYGRWAHVHNRWGWVPGPVGVRPVYAPALVAFVGGGVSIGVGGPVGWFPLGPGEVYNPWYRASRGYYTNVNVTNIYVRNNRNLVINHINERYNYYRDGRAAPNERYINRDVPHAFRAMSGQDFVAARNARQHMAGMDPRRFADAQVAPRGVAGIAPVRSSFAPPRANNGRPLPAGGFQREVVARTPPAANFGGRPANVAGNPRMTPERDNVRLLNGQGPAMRAGAPNRPQEVAAGQPNPSMRGNPAAPMARPQPRGDNEPGAMRPGELPSSRFVRPNGQAQIQRGGDNQPRPGVSFIPSAESDRMRSQQVPPGSLPTPPRIEPAQPQQARQDNTAQQRQDIQQQQMQQRRAAQQQQLEQRQQTQQQDVQQRQVMQMQQQSPQRDLMQQRQQMQQQEFQQRQAMQQQMQQRDAAQQRQQMQQRQEMQQRNEVPRGNPQPQQPQARPEQRQPQPNHEEHRAAPRRDDQQRN
jgi:hypothetical protein